MFSNAYGLSNGRRKNGPILFEKQIDDGLYVFSFSNRTFAGLHVWAGFYVELTEREIYADLIANVFGVQRTKISRIISNLTINVFHFGIKLKIAVGKKRMHFEIQLYALNVALYTKRRKDFNLAFSMLGVNYYYTFV